MSDTVDLITRIQERIQEKDMVIGEQMEQIADLEDRLEELQAEIHRLAEENTKIKKQLEGLV